MKIRKFLNKLCLPQNICIMTSLQGHPHHGMHQWDIRIMTCTMRIFASLHTQMDICIITYLKGNICIMTYPLEDICISISVRRHLHHGLIMCAGTIMDKLCICDKSQIYIRFNPIYLVFCIVYHLFWTFLCVFMV